MEKISNEVKDDKAKEERRRNEKREKAKGVRKQQRKYYKESQGKGKKWQNIREEYLEIKEERKLKSTIRK